MREKLGELFDIIEAKYAAWAAKRGWPAPVPKTDAQREAWIVMQMRLDELKARIGAMDREQIEAEMERLFGVTM